MSDSLDLNTIIANVLQSNFEHLLQAVTAGGRDLLDRVRVRLRPTYRTYIQRILKRHTFCKSFFIRSEPVPLYSFFTPLDLATYRRTLVRPDVTEITSFAHFSLITGIGGSGKSMMMRHLLLSTLTAGLKTPVFLELRSLNNGKENLETAILRTVQAGGLAVEQSFIEKAMGTGQLLLLLDGFDELSEATRDEVASDIQRLTSSYPESYIVVSSRPDSSLDGWEAFTQFALLPLTLEKAVELVARVPYDKRTKERFIEDLNAHLFSSHRSFLSNPLLLSIMLLTYNDAADIPHKISTFYEQAYEALFFRHDALKPGYHRPRLTKLDHGDFARVFSAFSILTYDQRELSFTETRALDLLETAKTITMLGYNSRDYLTDAKQAISLLVEEGLDVKFSHRSFQEYFVARFIQLSPSQVKGRLVQRLSPTAGPDAVLRLLHEMDPYIVEQEYILPALSALRKKLRVVNQVGVSQYLRHLRLMYHEFTVLPRDDRGEHVMLTQQDRALHQLVGFIVDRYKDLHTFANDFSDQMLLLDAYRAEFGSRKRVPVRSIRSSSPFLRVIADHGGFWSLKFVQALMEFEQSIRISHAESIGPIEGLLG